MLIPVSFSYSFNIGIASYTVRTVGYGRLRHENLDLHIAADKLAMNKQAAVSKTPIYRDAGNRFFYHRGEIDSSLLVNSKPPGSQLLAHHAEQFCLDRLQQSHAHNLGHLNADSDPMMESEIDPAFLNHEQARNARKQAWASISHVMKDMLISDGVLFREVGYPSLKLVYAGKTENGQVKKILTLSHEQIGKHPKPQKDVLYSLDIDAVMHQAWQEGAYVPQPRFAFTIHDEDLIELPAFLRPQKEAP